MSPVCGALGSILDRELEIKSPNVDLKCSIALMAYTPMGPHSQAIIIRTLKELGFEGSNPWEQWANSAEGDDGELLSGWLMSHADRPARVAEEHGETAYTTSCAMEFMEWGWRYALVLASELY